jgi:hypothetical protein
VLSRHPLKCCDGAALSLYATEEEPKHEYDNMSPHKEEDIKNINETQEEADTEAKTPGQMFHPLAEFADIPGTRHTAVTPSEADGGCGRPVKEGIKPGHSEE